MSIWGPAIFSDDFASDIKHEYNVLLSCGLNNEDVEKRIIDYYSPIINTSDTNEDVFWFALAMSEWQKGRLSIFVKEKALEALSSGNNLEYWKKTQDEKNYNNRRIVLSNFKSTIQSQMPSMKKIKKPNVHHCPWKAGSLLAYRIISNKEMIRRPSFNRIVLLRVVEVCKRPISKKFDTGYYDESMLVGLYDWIGDKIPEAKIVSQLKYIPICENKPLSRINANNIPSFNSLTIDSQKEINNVLTELSSKYIERFVWLDWLPTGSSKGEIKLLDFDENFADKFPEYFVLPLQSRTICNLLPMDTILCNIFDTRFIK